MKPRILVISPGVLPLPPTLGGAVENMIWRLDHHLQSDFDLEYASVSGDVSSSETERDPRIHYIRSINPLEDFSNENNFELMESNKWSDYEAFVSELVANGSYDVVHIHNEAALTPAIHKASPSSQIILHINDEVMSKMSTDQLQEIAVTSPLILSCSRLVAANVAFAFDDARVQIPAHDLFYNFVDTNEYDPGRFSPEQRLSEFERIGLDPNKVTVLYAGRVIEQKGVHLALQAYKAQRESNQSSIGKPTPELQMLFVGAPWYSRENDSAYYIQLTRQLDDSGAIVKFTGYVPHADMPKFYSLGDIFLAPSIWDDPSPFVTYEAQAMKLPVIAGARGGIPEIVENGTTGYCIDPFNTALFSRLLTDLCDDNLREKMGSAGRRRMMRNFSVTSAARRMRDIYHSLCTM